MAKSGEGFDWLQPWSMFDNLHPPPPALIAALNWSFINTGTFAVTAPAPSPAYLAAPAGSPWAGASPGWEGCGEGCGKGPSSSSTTGRGTSSPTLGTRSSGRSQTPQGSGGEEEAAFKGFRKPELGLEQQVGIFYRHGETPSRHPGWNLKSFYCRN